MKALSLIFLTLFAFKASCATYTTTATGGTWSPAGTPGSGDDLVINHDWSAHNSPLGYNYTSLSTGGSITVNSGGYFNIWGALVAGNSSSITINSGGTLEADGLTVETSATLNVASGGTLTVTGSISLNGTAGAITFDGSITANGATNNASTVTGSGTWTYTGSWANSGTVNGETGDLGGSPIDLSTLPVELSKFIVFDRGDYNEIIWQTTAEINNDYFEVLRSKNGVDFDVIGIVMGAGNSIEVLDYSYIDLYNSAGDTYYQLKQVDFNGDIEYSNIVLVGDKFEGIKLQEDQFRDEIKVIAQTEGEFVLEVFDLTGRVIIQSIINTEKGGIYTFPVNKSGIVFANVSGVNTDISKKIVFK